MKTSKILTAFSKLSDNNLESMALAISTAMTANPNFPEPQPSLAEFNDSIKAFSDALALAKTRDKVKVAKDCIIGAGAVIVGNTIEGGVYKEQRGGPAKVGSHVLMKVRDEPQ